MFYKKELLENMSRGARLRFIRENKGIASNDIASCRFGGSAYNFNIQIRAFAYKPNMYFIIFFLVLIYQYNQAIHL